MAGLEEIKRRIKSGEDLQSVVRTMKTLSAVNIRHYEKAIESLSEYNRTVEMGLFAVLKGTTEQVLARPSKRREGTITILFGSDQGLCGRFNDIMLDHARTGLDHVVDDANSRIIVCIGARLLDLLTNAHVDVHEELAVPGSLSGITPMMQELLLRIEGWLKTRSFDRVTLMYHKITSGVSYEPQTVHLLPLDRLWLGKLSEYRWPTRAIPTLQSSGSLLFSRLIRQYLFVSLFRAAAESMAAENASRLASMQSAEKNIGDTLDLQRKTLRLQRQNDITDELIDIISGFEALTGDAR
jgi:F-type H+-transporting ATPase subunit gamma